MDRQQYDAERYDEQYTTAGTDPNATTASRENQSLSTADLAGMNTQPTTQEPPGTPTRAEDTMREERPTATTRTTHAATEEDHAGPLLNETESQGLRARWDEVQTGFVDDPRQAVERADQLVAEAMKRLAETFANERSTLEGQWSRGDEVNTEDLRVALRRYRAFFDRLLTV